MQAIVLAAKGGPEFGPLTQGCSKGALPFLGEPLLAQVIRYLEGQGADRVRIGLCQQPFLLEQHFQEQPPEKAITTFHLEPATAGSANTTRRLAAGARETLVVAMGDLVTNIALDEAFAFHKQRGALVTLVLVPGDRAARAGRVTLGPEGRVTHFEEGGSDTSLPANTGIYLIEPEALTHVPATACDFGRDLFPTLIERNLPVYGYLCQEGYWIDAGHPAGYLQAVADVLNGRVAGVAPRGKEVQPGVWVQDGARIHAKAKLQAPVFVGAGARLDMEANVGPESNIEGPCWLTRGARVQQAAVFPDTLVGKATRWERQVLFPDGVIDLRGGAPVVSPTPAPDLLGTTYTVPLGDRLHGLLDQTLAAIGLFCLAPLLLLMTLAIKLESPGPAFYTQLRVGQDRRPYRRGTPRGQVFEVMKFRTMHLDADTRVAELMAQNQYAGGPFFKLERDPRITRVGDFLRKTSLDELPQLINVLRGEMRLVGNRPLPVYEADALQEDWQRTRFLAPAGITGLWQISGRSDLSDKERLALDAYYSATRTFLTDVAILFRTVPALLARRGAR